MAKRIHRGHTKLHHVVPCLLFEETKDVVSATTTQSSKSIEEGAA